MLVSNTTVMAVTQGAAAIGLGAVVGMVSKNRSWGYAAAIGGLTVVLYNMLSSTLSGALAGLGCMEYYSAGVNAGTPNRTPLINTMGAYTGPPNRVLMPAMGMYVGGR